MFYVLLGFFSVAGLVFYPKITLIVLVTFLVFYFTNIQIRSQMFAQLAKRKGFTKSGGLFILKKIISSQLDLFKDSEAKVLTAIYKEMGKYQIVVADVNTYYSVEGKQRYGRGHSSTKYLKANTTVICFIDEQLFLPRLSLYDETLGEKFIAAIGGQDIDFDEDEVFSNRFVLQGPSETNARDFFTKSMRSYFVQKMAKGFIFESMEDRFILRTKGFASKHEIEGLMSVGAEIYEKLRRES
jgi:hypothetical protein